jgi:hypothetical protein
MTKRKRKVCLILAALTMLALPRAWAVRPLITDDAALIGRKRMEIANWVLFDKYSGQFWHSVNIGLHDRVELTVAMFWGYCKYENDNRARMSFTAPLIQSKILIRDYQPNGFPGITIAVGSDFPFGTGAFVPSGYGAFAFVSLTQCVGKEENLLIHANIGGTYLCENKENFFGLTWGVGTQVKIYKGFHGVGEFVSGDPYVHHAGIGFQLGIRQFINDNLQIDFAVGSGIGNKEKRMPFWISSGIRWVFSFDKKNKTEYARNGRKITE